VGGSSDKQGTDPRIAARKSVELLRKSNVDKHGSISWTLKSPHESPTLSMYDRIIASPTTARMDLVACTSCELFNTKEGGEPGHCTYQHGREVLGKALSVRFLVARSKQRWSRPTYHIHRPLADVLTPVHLEEMGSEILRGLFVCIWSVAI